MIVVNDQLDRLNAAERIALEEFVRVPGNAFRVLVPWRYPTMVGTFVYHGVGDVVTDLDPTQAFLLTWCGLVDPVDDQEAR